MTRPRLWPILLAAAAGVALLLALGVWQVNRLKWKQALLAQLAANAAAEPVELSDIAAIRGRGGDVEFVKVAFRATYLGAATKKLMASFQGGPGWTVVTPAISADGIAVLVDRGLVPADRLGDVGRPDGEQELLGIVRTYPRGRAYFDPENDAAANLWYWWDIGAMLQASSLPETARPLPVVVQLLPGQPGGPFPQPAEPKANLANNHLGYAVTWFGLALALAAVTALYIRGLSKAPPPPASGR